MMYSDIYMMYLRKSRADGEHESVEEVVAKHEHMLQKHAVSLLGRTIPEKYIFREVVSGETIEDRPEIKKLLSSIESDNVKGVLVVDPQRLSRGDWEDGGKILSSFKYSNTLIITPTKTYNLHDKFDYSFFKMELSRGNDYLEYTKEILRRGRENSIESGNYIGSVAPYGYCKVFDENRKPTLSVNETEAQAVNLAVRLRVSDGLGWAYIARHLDNMGYKPRNGGLWNPYTLRDICINPVNIGLVKWNTRKTIKVYEDGKLTKTRPRNKKEDVIYRTGKHPAILDKDLYDKLIEKSGITTRERKNSELVNPLAGLIFCSSCNRAMSYRTYKRNGVERSAPRLLCNNQVHCKSKSSSFDVVFAMLIDSLESMVKDFDFKAENEDTSYYDLQQKAIQELEDKLKAYDKKRDMIYELVESGDYTKEEFRLRMSNLEKNVEETKKHIENLKESIPIPINYAEKAHTFRNVIDTLKNDDISAKHKNNLLKTIIDRVEYSRPSENRTKWDESKPALKIYLKDFDMTFSQIT